ncbi:MAG: hypothetical protein WA888_21695 [Burkholderiaceae bacterium]
MNPKSEPGSSNNEISQDASPPSNDAIIGPDQRIEAHLSAESAEVLNRRMKQIWRQALEQIGPLLERLHLDDEQTGRPGDQHVGIAMQVHTFDPDRVEERKRLRLVNGTD